MGVGDQRHAPAALPPRKKTTYCIGRRIWTRAENLAPPLGFDPRKAQPVASLHTDRTIPALRPLPVTSYFGVRIFS